MKLIVGLGNPGTKYKNTRHNVGFDMLGFLHDSWNTPNFTHEKKLFAEISKTIIEKEDILLAKPQTYMNESGKAVQAIKNFYKIKNTGIFVIQDDLDLPAGTFKIQTKRGSAGNKGIDSITKMLGGNDYYRWRIGIATEKSSFFGRLKRNFVLNKFKKSDAKKIRDILQNIKASLELAIKDSPEKAMNEFN